MPLDAYNEYPGRAGGFIDLEFLWFNDSRSTILILRGILLLGFLLLGLLMFNDFIVHRSILSKIG